MTSIEIKDLSISYARRSRAPVLKIPDLSISCGEVLAIFGPNHSGKSTLLKVLAGVPFGATVDGIVRYNGQAPENVERLRLSYLPQAYADTLFPWMSIERNLRLRLLAQQEPAESMDSQVAAIAKDLGYESERRLQEHFGFVAEGRMKRVADLSGGQRQIVTVLRALLPTPAVLLLDEPFSAIDVYKGAEFRNAVQLYVETKNISTIIVTHNLEEAVYLADRVVVLTTGQESSSIAAEYPIGDPKPGPNLEPDARNELVQRIRREHGLD